MEKKQKERKKREGRKYDESVALAAQL